MNKHSCRKVARHTSYRSRYTALTSNKQVEIRNLQKLLSILFDIYANTNNELYRECLQITTNKFLSISSLDGYEPVEKPLCRHVSIDSFSPSDCQIFFRFKKCDLN